VDHDLRADLRPPDDGVTCRIRAAARIAQRGCGDSMPRMVDPDLVVVTGWSPLCFGQKVAVSNVAAPIPGQRMLMLEPTVKRDVKISIGRRSREAGSGNEQERDEQNHTRLPMLRLRRDVRSAERIPSGRMTTPARRCRSPAKITAHSC
jgi:hypothetical protein